MPHFVIIDFACMEINNYCRPEHGILVGLVNYVAALTVLLFHIQILIALNVWQDILQTRVSGCVCSCYPKRARIKDRYY